MFTPPEAEMLDAYLEALLQDVDTPPPSGLDPKLATLARALVAGRVASDDLGLKARVWRKTLQAVLLERYQQRVAVSTYQPTESPSVYVSTRKEKNMSLVPLVSPRPLSLRLPRVGLSLAALSMVVAVGLLALWGLPPSGPSESAALLAEPMRSSEEGPADPSPTPVPNSPSDVTIPVVPPVSVPIMPQAPLPITIEAGQVGVYPLSSANAPLELATGDVILFYGMGQGVLPQSAHMLTSFSVQVIPYPGEAAATPLALGETVEGQVSAEQAVWVYEVDVPRGEVLQIQVEGDPAHDLQLHVFDPQSLAIIAGDDDSGLGYLPEITAVQLWQAGVYRVVVSATDMPAGEGLPFRLTVDRRPSPVLNLDETQTLRLSPKETAQTLRFTAEAGTRYRLTAQQLTAGGSVLVTVLQGEKQLANFTLLDANALSTSFVVSEAGEVLISANYLGVAEVKVTLEAE